MIVKTEPGQFISYLEDTSNLKGKADVLYIPENKHEISYILSKCNSKDIPVTCSGARTGTTGGCVPLEGALLSLERLNHINDIDVKKKKVTVEGGVSLSALEAELNKVGLTFRAQPTESLALVGAAASTCASGVRGVKYGSIRNYIRKIEVVLADGTIVTIKRGMIKANRRKFLFSLQNRSFEFSLPTYRLPKVKTQAGYFVYDNMDLIDLFIGSEGTLGVIVELEIDVQDRASAVFDGVAFFPEERAGFMFLEAVREANSKGRISPASVEFFDSCSLQFLSEDYPDIPFKGAAIYFEQEIDKDSDDMMNVWIRLLEGCGVDLESVWFGESYEERARIYEFRHKLPQKINEFLRQYNQQKLSTDIAVPAEHFYKMYDFYKEKANETGITYVNFGHVGEQHLHFNFLPRTDKEYALGKRVIDEFVRFGVKLGGTVSAEHGIGKIKKDYLKIMYGKRHIEEMARLKAYFDPNFILGRDNIFDKNILGKL